MTAEKLDCTHYVPTAVAWAMTTQNRAPTIRAAPGGYKQWEDTPPSSS